MMYMARLITEARTNRLIEKRDQAIRNKDYDSAWKLDMKINKNVNRLISFSYC